MSRNNKDVVVRGLVLGAKIVMKSEVSDTKGR